MKPNLQGNHLWKRGRLPLEPKREGGADAWGRQEACSPPSLLLCQEGPDPTCKGAKGHPGDVMCLERSWVLPDVGRKAPTAPSLVALKPPQSTWGF